MILFGTKGKPTYSSAEKPLPYDAEVEYLESTGTQWIDTRIFGRDNLDITLTVLVRSGWSYPESSSFICGCRGTTATSVTRITNNTTYFGCGLNSTPSSSSHSVIFDEWVELELDTTSANKKFLVNNDVARTATSTNKNVSARSMYLFGYANDNGDRLSYGLLVRKFSIRDTTTNQLLADYIPVRVGTVGYMYDRVSGNLFGNDGTGSFIVGRDINPISTRSYVNDGLVAMWDGIENAGWGTHDPNATTWKDLVGNNDLTIYGSVLDNCIATTSTAAAEKSGTISGIATIEVCHKFTTTQNLNPLGLIFYSGPINSSTLGLVYYGPSVGVQSYENVFWAYPSVMTQATRTATVTTSACYINGNALEAVSHSADRWNNTNYTGIGGRQWQNTWKTFGEYYNVRIYNRALTASEIAANYAIDKARFNLP